jgi:hypothetical protein
MSKMDRATLSKWANKPRDEVKVDQTKRDLWDGLNAFVGERGGAITSVRHTWPIRLEVDPESKLPEKLIELGHDLIFCSQETRIGPAVSVRHGWRTNVNGAYSFRTVDVYSIRLPK